MLLIIISIILAIITFIALGFTIEKPKRHNGDVWVDDKIYWKINWKQLFSPLWLILILFGCFTIVPANSIGIRYNPFNGGTQKTTLKEGIYAKNPLEKIYTLSTKINEYKFENISIQTKDSQYVNSTFQVQARIDGAQASTYFKKYGNKSLTDIQSILANTIQKEFERVTTQYNIMEVLGESRDAIVNQTLVYVQEELAKDGISVERIILVDTDASDDVEQAIRNEAVAKKDAEAAVYEKQKAETEGEAKVIAAQKEKEANELLNKTLTKELLIQEYIEKWDGKLPTVSSGSDTIIDIGDLLSE